MTEEFRWLPQCDRCQFQTNSALLRCTVHPGGVDWDNCSDFQADLISHQRHEQFLGLNWVAGEDFEDAFVVNNPFSSEEGQWEPNGASYYAGDLIIEGVPSVTRARKLEMLARHPLFTGRCPECEGMISTMEPPQIHWDCQRCGWKDDSL